MQLDPQTILLAVLTVVNAVYLIGRWTRTREHHDAEARQDIARLDAEILQIRKRAHDLADAAQNDRIRIVVLETQMKVAQDTHE